MQCPEFGSSSFLLWQCTLTVVFIVGVFFSWVNYTVAAERDFLHKHESEVFILIKKLVLEVIIVL